MTNLGTALAALSLPILGALGGLLTPSPAPSLPAPAPALNQTAVAHFVAGQTDGLSQVSGTETFTQVGTGTITVTGSVAGLRPTTMYVTVPYFDGGCIPAAGVTAFPSSSFTTDALGSANFTGTVNPKAINPLGTFTVGQTHSVSIRQVLVQGVQVPGLPIGTPTIPNVGAVETCDHAPVVTNQ